MPDNEDISLENMLNPSTSQVVENPPTNLDTGNEDLTSEEIAAKAALDKPVDKPAVDANIDTDTDVNEQELKTLLSTFISEDNLEDTDATLRKELLTKFNGTSFDANGNLIDAEGNVKAEFKDVLDYVNTDGLTIDAEGNQVDAEGTIVKTAYDLAIENTVVNKLASETGYELLDEDGKPKIYSDDDEGFKDLTNDISAERFKDFKQEFFEQNPVLSEVAKHLLSGNTLDTFQQATDYTTIDVDKLSDADKEAYIRRSFEVKGMDKTQTDNMLQLIKDSNSLTDQAKLALPALQTYDEQTISNRDIAYQQTIKEQNDAIEAHWNKAQSIVKEGKLSNITIPADEKDAFYDYISTAVDDKGNSKEAIDRGKETLEQKLAYSYLRYKGFDLSKLAKREAGKIKITSLKERIRKSKSLKDSPINDANTGVTSGDSDVTLERLLATNNN